MTTIRLADLHRKEWSELNVWCVVGVRH